MKQPYFSFPVLSFDDVLLLPQYSEIKSRLDVDISTTLSTRTKLKIPIMATNMSTITEKEMMIEMGKLGGCGCLHRFMPSDDIIHHIQDAHRARVSPVIASIGVKDEDKALVNRFLNMGLNAPDVILVDIAHGDSQSVVEIVKWLKQFSHEFDIIGGNVATKDGYKRLFDAGCDAVRAGIGGGCFIAGTMVTTDKYKKPIEKIKIGDKVLTFMGVFKKVVATQKRIESSTILDINGIKCTKNHKFYVVSKENSNKITDDNIHEYAEWISAEELSDNYFLIRIKV